MHYRIPKDTEMTPEILAKYIRKHKADIEKRNRKLQNAYENKYEIYDCDAKPAYKPDNRVSINFAKYIVDTFNGFFCGVPIKTTSEDPDVQKLIEFLDQYNDQDNNNFELSKLSDIHGSAHEMYYLDENSQPCITYISPMESFFLVDESILERPLFFVRYYVDSNNVEHGSWSDASVVQHFVNHGSYVWEDEPKIHGFADVPATEYIDNDEQTGIFESSLPAINAYNKAISEKCNDVDYFADSYLKILGAKVEDDDVHHIRSNRIINFEGDSESLPEVEFLQKPDADTTQEHLIDRLERLIFQISMVPNINADSFGSSSGIALRYKLQSMHNLFRAKERRFTSGMNRRYRVIFSNPAATSGFGVAPDDYMLITYTFTPNYPANLADEAETAAKLSGIVSQKTQLKVLSIVDNPAEEIDSMASEHAAELDIYGDQSGSAEVTHGEDEP